MNTLAANSSLARSPVQSPCVLGIDPGLVRTGYAVLSAASGGNPLREAGIIRLNPRDRLEQRLCELATALAELLDSHRPIAVAVEALYAHYKHPRTAILMGHARGVVLAEAARAAVPVISVAATQVKKTLTGHGRAGKRQMQQAIAATLGLSVAPEPADVADAIAIALCGILLRRGNNRLRPIGGAR